MGKHFSKNELTGVMQRPETISKTVFTWRPNSLWIMQRCGFLLIECIEVARKVCSPQLMSKAGKETACRTGYGRGACWDQTPRNQSVFPAAPDSCAACGQGAETAPPTQGLALVGWIGSWITGSRKLSRMMEACEGLSECEDGDPHGGSRCQQQVLPVWSEPTVGVVGNRPSQSQP